MANTFQLNFVKMLDEFGITGAWLAKQLVPEGNEKRKNAVRSNLSDFRLDKTDVRVSTLARWYGVCPPDAKRYFLEQLAGYSLLPRRPKLSDLIAVMDEEDLSDREEAALAVQQIITKFMSSDRKRDKVSVITDTSINQDSLKSL